MRTTLTLDEDVAEKIQAEMREKGASFKATVNAVLRRGLNVREKLREREPFRVHARDLGELQPGLDLDNIGELLEQLEGRSRR